MSIREFSVFGLVVKKGMERERRGGMDGWRDRGMNECVGGRMDGWMGIWLDGD